MSPALARSLVAPGGPAADRSAGWHALGRLLESAGSSYLFAWLLVAGWQLVADPRLSALLVVAWLLPRRLALLVVPRLGARSRRVLGWLSLVPAAAALLLPLDPDARSLLMTLAVVGLAGGYLAAERSQRGRVGQPTDRLSRLGLVAGAALASVTLLVTPGVALWVGLLVWLAGWLVAELFERALAGGADTARPPERPSPAARPSTPGGFRPLVQPRELSYLAAAFSAGAVLATLYAWLPRLLTVGAGLDVALVGGALALVGAGALLPLPVVRLRLRLPPALLVAGLAASLAAGVALVALLGPLLVGLALLPLVGLLAATLDAEQLVALRRAGRTNGHGIARLVAAFVGGQLAGALAVALLGSEPVLIGGPPVLLALAAGLVAALALGLDRHSLGALRHQVQQFSWNARPTPRPFAQPPAGTRAARLAGWIHRRVETELVDVTLPVSGRQYAIARPSGDGRDSLFEQAKADPERQMPYWAKVWPSGVALADVVVERSDEVRGQQVLELGAGLGVTAVAVLEEGGRVVTADYSLLPLALCRLNGLLNSGRAPGSICFNWRDEAQVREVLRRHPPIGLILAADVLYEFRDIQPLIDVIERLLAPGGSLWLAEPVRRTAQRFLDSVAARGWQSDSRRIRAEWADATDGWVNVHVIRRDDRPSGAVLALGGWQP